jgi:four helix bundle protein
MRNFINSKLWQNSKVFVKNLYKVITKFPSSEKLGMVNQISRAVLFIPTKIVKGVKYRKKNFSNFLNVSLVLVSI